MAPFISCSSGYRVICSACSTVHVHVRGRRLIIEKEFFMLKHSHQSARWLGYVQ